MIVTHKIEMDFLSKKENAAIPQIRVVQGDCNSRMLELTLFADQVAWTIPGGVSVQMRYRKPDGTGGIYDTMPDGAQAWNINGNTVSVLLAPQMLAVAGIVRSQVALILNGNFLAAFEVRIAVEEDPSAGTLESEDYTNLQLWMTEEIEGALRNAKQAGTFDGATFTPKVSAAGVLSWTNNKGLANPASVNINAPQGILPVANGGTGAATAAAARTNLGAAAAGYGYGEVPVSLGSADDDTAFVATVTEQFSLTASKTRKVRFTKGGSATIGELWSAGNGYGVLLATTYAEKNVGYIVTKLCRLCKNGVWQEWEYENPPLVLNAEYRTTERYGGKPVYIKRVNLGALPNVGSKRENAIPVGVSIVDFSCFAYNTSASGNALVRPITVLSGITDCFCNTTLGQIGVDTNADMSGYTAIATVKYTKD